MLIKNSIHVIVVFLFLAQSVQFPVQFAFANSVPIPLIPIPSHPMLRRNLIVQISCILSMIGAFFVCITTRFPIQNRKKTGKSLLFWLSITDFMSSLVYYISTLLPHEDASKYCTYSALFGIFFPVASFLWTDAIALYLYVVIIQRNHISHDPWEGRLKYCHLFIWSLCILIIVLVASFHQTGSRGSEGTNWCWIKASDPTTSFLWELVGGKFIEWASCFIVLPFLFISASVKLVQLEKSEYSLVQSTDATQHKLRAKFSLFYLKMAAGPFLFFFVRFWGSLRVVLNAANISNGVTWLAYLQDACDPSQGSINFLLFVVCSRDGRSSVCLAFKIFIDTLQGGEYYSQQHLASEQAREDREDREDREELETSLHTIRSTSGSPSPNINVDDKYLNFRVDYKEPAFSCDVSVDLYSGLLSPEHTLGSSSIGYGPRYTFDHELRSETGSQMSHSITFD